MMPTPSTLDVILAQHHLSHHHATRIDSTNEYLKQSILTGTLAAHQWHLCTADAQTQGRGQHGRAWQSPVGNLYLSLYHPISVPLSGLLSLLVAYELMQMPVIAELRARLHDISSATTAPSSPAPSANAHISHTTSHTSQTPDAQHKRLGHGIDKRHGIDSMHRLGIKWVNDLGYYLPDGEFAKLAGILIEPVRITSVPQLLTAPALSVAAHASTMSATATMTQGVIIGVGINVANAPTLTTASKEGLPYQPVSLSQIALTIQSLEEQFAHSLGTQPPMLNALQNTAPNMASQLCHDLYAPVTEAVLNAVTHFAALHSDVSGRALAHWQRDFAVFDVLAGRTIVAEQQGQRHTGVGMGIDKQGCYRLRRNDGQVISLINATILSVR